MPAEKDRQQLAITYRDKSDESFICAQECLQNGRYRSSCNRAWYSIYQAISAGVYAKLRQDPPKDRQYWNHNAAEQLFGNFLRASNLTVRYGFLAECLPVVRVTRVLADYLSEDGKITKEDAQNALATAERIRRVIYGVIGWNGNGNG